MSRYLALPGHGFAELGLASVSSSGGGLGAATANFRVSIYTQSLEKHTPRYVRVCVYTHTRIYIYIYMYVSM